MLAKSGPMQIGRPIVGLAHAIFQRRVIMPATAYCTHRAVPLVRSLFHSFIRSPVRAVAANESYFGAVNIATGPAGLPWAGPVCEVR